VIDGIEYRGSAQATVELLAEYAGVPVWNGLTDEFHPTQSLCDMVTMQELSGKASRGAHAVGGDVDPGVVHEGVDAAESFECPADDPVDGGWF
jgi:ornithine carbamoyltransferase